jgi:hypothetical protein
VGSAARRPEPTAWCANAVAATMPGPSAPVMIVVAAPVQITTHAGAHENSSLASIADGASLRHYFRPSGI